MSLVLGGVTFNVDELPEEINFGGEQVLAIRKFPGGGMDIQAMGTFDDPIAWSGTFMYVGAIDRALLLEAYKNQAKPLQMSISKFKRTVIINLFKFRYDNDFYIPYDITIQPIDGTVNGTTMTMSTVKSSATSGGASSASAVPPKTVYVVKSSDTLWKIAADAYADGSKWPIIAQANNIKEPSKISPGMKLTIPPSANA